MMNTIRLQIFTRFCQIVKELVLVNIQMYKPTYTSKYCNSDANKWWS